MEDAMKPIRFGCILTLQNQFVTRMLFLAFCVSILLM